MSLSLALALGASAAFAEPVSLGQFSFDAPQHAQPVEGATVEGVILYPAAQAGAEEVYAENPVFRGVLVQRDGEVAEGAHPAGLLRHGMGGEMSPMAWLAAGLAERGAIVIAVTHPNTSWSDFDLAEGIKRWARAQDLSAAFDTVLDDPRFAGAIDPARVMAAGFSCGGWTALSLGGARAHHAGMIAACTEMRAVWDVCSRFVLEEVGLADIDPAVWDASYRDPRVSLLAAIESGFVWGMAAETVAQLAGSVTLIGLGDETTRFVDTDLEASGLSALLPEADVEWIAPGHRFTGMPLCTPAGPGIHAEEKDDPVCSGPDGADPGA